MSPKLKNFNGRKILKTNIKITGNPDEDVLAIPRILKRVLPIHEENAADEDFLFKIYFNQDDYWDKEKKQRNDIDNKITVDAAWAISRTINFYCFGEPIKYISRDTNEATKKQEAVEILSEFLDYQHNHDATTMATLCSSVCGLGYKLALPANEDELNFSGIPFVINSNIILPQKAFCVYSDDVISEKILGVIVGNNYNSDDEIDGKKYTVWTKTHQYVFNESKDGQDLVPELVKFKDTYTYAYPTQINRIPLVEIERNAFRKGDWEICLDLLSLKNKLASQRADDIQQVIDYILVLINCQFETEEERKQAITDRIFELQQKDPKNKPEVQILKNALQQSDTQVYADYIDTLIETVAGIPSRAERSGGGHDTGAAVIYRNGFRDLENNAGMIIPKMDKAETEFVGICIAYSHNLYEKDKLKNLNPYDVRNKFTRSLSDDPLTASTAYYTFKKGGMNDLDALIASKAVTDPAEVHKNNKENPSNIEEINTETTVQTE